MLLSGKVNKYFLIVQEVMSPTFCASNCRDQKVKKLEGSERVSSVSIHINNTSHYFLLFLIPYISKPLILAFCAYVREGGSKSARGSTAHRKNGSFPGFPVPNVRGNSRTTPQSWFRCHVRQTHAGQPVRPRSILGGTRPSARLDVDNRTRANRWHPGGDHPRFQRNRPTEKVGKFSPPFLTTRAIAAPWRPRARLQTNFSTRANAWRLWLFPNGGER